MTRDPATTLAGWSASALLDLTVALGLACYAGRIDDPEPPLQLIRNESDAMAREAGIDRLDWISQRAELAKAWRRRIEEPLCRLARQLRLTQPDLFLVGLAAACERRPSVALAVAVLQAPLASARPTVHLALHLVDLLFDAGAGDAAFLASGPLIEYGLLALEGEDALPHRVLAIRLPLWRALSAGGVPSWPGCKPVAPAPASATGVPELAIRQTAQAILAGDAGGVVIRGPSGSGRAQVAAAIADVLGLAAIEAPLAVLREDRGFATACRIVDWMPVLRVGTDLGEVVSLGETGLPTCVLAGSHGAVEGDGLIELRVAPPPVSDRIRLWNAALGSDQHDIDAATLSAAVLYPGTISAVGRGARIRAESKGRAVTSTDLAAARLTLAPNELGRLAHPVDRPVGPDAMVTSAGLAEDLSALIARCRRRESIWEGLGPSLAASATRGVRALFAGESGTGKTMAASYVATELAAPLYRCDLAAVMNKYIGESEKNLGGLLDHAEAADVVLLFDEADALFGRRSEGTETGERYANMLTNYLLTRLEAHNGIVILTTNSKARIEPAFWRRLDHVIDFPSPGYSERLALWKSHLGQRAPPEPVIEHLAAYCDLAGGNVRNAVLAAAALAPPDRPLGLDDLLAALQREYAKLRRTLPAVLAVTMRAAE
jgi:hypothetical protein